MHGASLRHRDATVVSFVICFALSQASRRLEVGYTPRAARAKIREVQLRDQVA